MDAKSSLHLKCFSFWKCKSLKLIDCKLWNFGAADPRQSLHSPNDLYVGRQFLTCTSSLLSSSLTSSIHCPVGVLVPRRWSFFLSRQQRAASSTGPQRRRNKRRRRRRRRRRRPAVGRQPPKGEGGRPAPMLWQIAADSTRPQLLDRRPWNRKTLSSGMIFQVLQTTEALICSSCELSKVSLLKDCDICLPDLSIVKRILDEKIEEQLLSASAASIVSEKKILYTAIAN